MSVFDEAARHLSSVIKSEADPEWQDRAVLSISVKRRAPPFGPVSPDAGPEREIWLLDLSQGLPDQLFDQLVGRLGQAEQDHLAAGISPPGLMLFMTYCCPIAGNAPTPPILSRFMTIDDVYDGPVTQFFTGVAAAVDAQTDAAGGENLRGPRLPPVCVGKPALLKFELLG